MTGSVLEVSQDAVQAFVYREARLLDERRYDDWLGLWAGDRDVLYWVPAGDDHDGAGVISYVHDNGRRLNTRVRQLLTGERYSQVPFSRTARIVSGVEREQAGPGAVTVHAAFALHEFRMDRTHVWAGRLEFDLVDPAGDGTLRMTRKKVLLVDRAGAVPSMAFLL
ncbi:ring-hydroxylating dioxygenase subunit beta [Pseudonocardia sp. KRD-184]|uniref:Ring-hydroxylating dioxygenase subunit beta n=1 Tax=Pseudonocardia oceani TaxID=2792013 RepID=A0ABS6U2A7_9PSEU|nr:aromatic-ring-hydroxylating dioxygenase subunit beta [Pseudonocardia oceani]MBW0091156.1 ring-hydroxylating dioxygenase subunit beta [Pseudonocardia oceani]MBW0095073.1 ring-hydroxylating dioxygenase subunit beta [Pseudonocardia oceani]MBW0107190.1 ring-hydroxylating dioxygenase subunit beta [Pseudonocardia oceani]MBW0119714.1 ring-hydroxylating dioxygenase subunit beta [Pseudonocardia oceani]MBW0126377.1 ring-hydroxylating dioxygenase subunit beta [Pseudonocardia oceani]